MTDILQSFLSNYFCDEDLQRLFGSFFLQYSGGCFLFFCNEKVPICFLDAALANISIAYFHAAEGKRGIP